MTGRQLLEQRTLDGCMVASLILPVLFSPATFPSSWVHGHCYTWARILTAFRKAPFSWLQLRKFCCWAVGESQNQEEVFKGMCVEVARDPRGSVDSYTPSSTSLSSVPPSS